MLDRMNGRFIRPDFVAVTPFTAWNQMGSLLRVSGFQSGHYSELT
jgi:hypothetical protein